MQTLIINKITEKSPSNGKSKTQNDILDHFELYEPCRYSFRDLISASGKTVSQHGLNKLHNASQEERNSIVRLLCIKAGWYYKDMTVDNIVYTAFSPILQLKKISRDLRKPVDIIVRK